MLRSTIFIIFIISSFLSFSQDNFEVIEPSYIKSVTLKAHKVNAFVPIIKLGESLDFSFDDLEGDDKDYTYKIDHCTFDWKKSALESTEFSNGFAEDRIRTSENSFNTYQDYTNYLLTIPNQSMQLKVSGNYLISVLDEDEEVVFTRRFVVYQPKVDVGVSIHKARKIDAIASKQNIEFIINHPNLRINNASEEIKVAVYQNNDWNNVITNLKPQFYRGTQLIYKYGEKTTFFGGNEYLYFDSKDVRNATNNIRRVVLNDLYDTRLYVDASRINKPYTHYPDVNGNYFVRTINAENSLFEADYTKVHFVYEFLENVSQNENLYVYGAFNNWQLNDENRLTYNETTKFYETDIILKQGFYNYTYVLADENLEIDNTIEGSHYQTENEYSVLVYYKKTGSKYTEVVGFGSGNSVDLKN